jgi:hypothetical protein
MFFCHRRQNFITSIRELNTVCVLAVYLSEGRIKMAFHCLHLPLLFLPLELQRKHVMHLVRLQVLLVVWRWLSSGVLRSVVFYKLTDVSRVFIASIIRAMTLIALIMEAGIFISGVMAIGHKVGEFKPCRGQCTLRAIRILSMTSFGEEVKPSAPCRKILRHVKNPFEV